MLSLDGSVYSALGPMQRVGSGRRYPGFNLPAASRFCLREWAQLSSELVNGSGSLIQSTRQFHIERVFADEFE